jgi:hypothetical protein
MYGVWCQVSGGVTGTRAGWMKENGKRVELPTLEEAEQAAAEARELASRSTARHEYTACEVPHGQ